jgi:hypothetical protein
MAVENVIHIGKLLDKVLQWAYSTSDGTSHINQL